MHVEIEDFKTGWYGIGIGIRENEIDILIEQLKKMKQEKTQHFHLSSEFEGDGGIGDIEFYLQKEGKDNMQISGFEIPPTR